VKKKLYRDTLGVKINKLKKNILEVSQPLYNYIFYSNHKLKSH